MNPQDPLAQLREIHTPEAIANWPPAIGWWILLVLTVVVIIYLTFFIYKYWHNNRYRKIAANALASAYRQYQSNNSKQQYLLQYSALLRRAALTRHTNQQVAGLTGVEWLNFLDQTLGSNEFSQGPGKVIVTAPYQQTCDIDIKPLHKLGTRWIKKHKVMSRL